MPQIVSDNKALKSLKGLHLWHAPMSSCSQRVRIALSEAGRSFESHVIDLEKDAHATAEYQSIHPKGLVPAMVQDGTLWIESVDIIQELAGGIGIEAPDSARDLLQLADDAQLDLKLLTFEFLFRAKPAPAPQAADAFQKSHRNDWLTQFRRDFAAGFAPERVNAAIARTDAGFWTLEERLVDGRAFLGGDQFSSVDIAWMPNLHRFDLMGWPFARYPRLNAWRARISERQCYQEGLVAWEPDGVAQFFAEYTAQRRAANTDLLSFAHFQAPEET